MPASTLALLIAFSLIDGDGPGHHLFTGLYLHTRGPSTLALLIALFIAPGPEYESAGHRDQNMKVLAHLHGQNTCVDIINERFDVRGFAPSSLDVTLKFRCQGV